MNELEAKIFDVVKNATYDRRKTSKDFKAAIGIDKRLLAAQVRNMNEIHKGTFFIGCDRNGYWLCRSEAEALACLKCYHDTIYSMLREKEKMIDQIRVTFATNKDLFGTPILIQ